MFSSLLVANRGEIACRIFRTARAMGLRCIAVYSEADARAKHVREADEAHLIGPPPAAQSYLDIGAILEAAGASGAEAIHPGYGFLSENPDFAEAVISAGLIWVGPTPASIRSMGLKDEAKRIAEEAGAPVVPGYRGADQDERVLAEAAREIGFPVLIKAIAGGGGRGIREVRAADEFSAALASAQREAKAAFGDDRVLIEKLIQRPRHIEVQVFGDKHGGLVHLFERDCSLQRRRQKVIEEAPAPGMTDEVRAVMTDAALKIARAVNYENAGTVEFIVEGAPRADNFYFMEMNTRLQVEHPVTEAITGLDLVEWQLRVAAGETLPKAQDEIAMRGHAIEARICAEDPAQDFRPSIGRIAVGMSPRRDMRIDAGFDEGDTVPPDYDSLLAKAIASAPSRDAAIALLLDQLQHSSLAGVSTNTGFIYRALSHEGFGFGAIDTDFLSRTEALFTPNSITLDCALAAAALKFGGFLHEDRDGLWSARDGFRLNQSPSGGFSLSFDGSQRGAIVRWQDANICEVEVALQRTLTTSYVFAGFSHPGRIGFEPSGPGARAVTILSDDALIGPEGDVHRFGPPHFDLDAVAASDSILAPLPGKIAAINVASGASVKRGDVLAILEAMKMEHTLIAPRDGVVAEVAVSAGAQVRQRDLVVRLASV